MKLLFLTFTVPLSLLLTATNLLAKSVTVISPDKQIQVTINDNNNRLHYQVSFNGNEIISPSALGMTFKDAPALGEGFTINKVERSSVDNHWDLPWGERKTVKDKHNEVCITFSANRQYANTFKVRFRVFDDGIGFRYEVPKQNGLNGENINITSELTEFVVNNFKNTTAWWIPAHGWDRYEYIYNTTPLEKIDRANTPLTFKINAKNHSPTYVSIHEAALIDYSSMSLDQRRPGVLKADLAPWSDGVLVKTQPNFKTPWRTIQVSKEAIGLINSDLILNLNEPNKLGDVSWVHPGKYVGIWWAMHMGEKTWASGKKHGATTAETKKYIDFAANYGFSGVLVEGWNKGWDGDWFNNGDLFSFTQSYTDFDLKAVTDYGKKKGVKLIGHNETSGNVTNYHKQMVAAYSLYEKMGVSQVKTGYVADGGNIKRIDEKGIIRKEWHDGQFMVGEYLHSVTEAAKHHISIDTHEPIKDTGLRRTYPNWLTREGARGQEYNAWGNPPNPPEHTTILPFTRMLSGPMDFTPGIFNMSFNGLGDHSNRPQTTLAKQLALYVVLYSPIQMAADLPRNYEANLPAFQFIRDVPTDWQQSKAIAGEIGDYIVIARQDRHSDDWYLGGLTDEQARTLLLPLTFLSKSKHYQAQIYRDGKNTEWKNNPYEMVIEQKNVTNHSKLLLKLATSGGVAIRFKALD